MTIAQAEAESQAFLGPFWKNTVMDYIGPDLSEVLPGPDCKTAAGYLMDSALHNG